MEAHHDARAEARLLQRLCLRGPALGLEADSQVVIASGGFGVLGAQHLLLDGQRLRVQRLGLLVAALGIEVGGQVVEAQSGERVPWPQHLLIDGQGLAQERLGLFGAALGVEVIGQVVEARGGIGVPWTQRLLLDGQGLADMDRRLGLFAQVIKIPRVVAQEEADERVFLAEQLAHPIDYLIDSILDPNKAIKDGFQGYTIVTQSGDVYSGIKVRQDAKQLVLRDNAHQEIPILLSQIKARKEIGSLMPNGLADFLTHQELLDLVKFLSELGKVGAYMVGPARLVRRWRVLEPTTQARQFLQRDGFAAAAGAEPALAWSPAYSTVSGVLPLDTLPPLSEDANQFAIVQCQLEASAPGRVRLRLNSRKGIALWLDRDPVEPSEEITLAVAAGVHALTFAVNRTQRNEGLRCELDDLPGSAARVRVVGGK